MSEFESSKGGARVRVPPPLVFIGAVVAGWLLPGLRIHGHLPLRVGLGALLIAGALALGAPALRLFRKTGQHPRPWLPTPELIFQGPYRYTRNPMYLGMTSATLGISLLAGNGWMAALAFVALAVVHLTAVLPEERYLTARFGDPYTQYVKSVRRYF